MWAKNNLKESTILFYIKMSYDYFCERSTYFKRIKL
ncbi:hypothetical protein ALC56_01482 [Trachymyrmex septentrionalis]|uniref:Uncharacterized protein n=1 Tax=Trachymyrmex septentrionalis TaxID=34720 RepID=A0A195FUR7_9HYME|nr:hypothetical protein ALC56_01482 [Trachymyrmex septentrionalis]